MTNRASAGEVWYLVDVQPQGGQNGTGVRIFLHSRIQDSEWWIVRPDRVPLKRSLRLTYISKNAKDDVDHEDFPPMDDVESWAMDMLIEDLNNGNVGGVDPDPGAGGDDGGGSLATFGGGHHSPSQHAPAIRDLQSRFGKSVCRKVIRGWDHVAALRAGKSERPFAFHGLHLQQL